MFKKFRNSISAQITGIMFISIALIIVVVWLMNSIFLDDYYMEYKISSIEDAFVAFDKASSEGILYSEAYSEKIDELSDKESLAVMVISSDGTVIMQTERKSAPMMEQLFGLMLGGAASNSEIIKSNDKYSIQRITEERTDNEFLTLWGTLDDGNLMLIRSTLQSVNDAVRMSNRLLIFIGIGALVLGICFSALAARHITRPVYEMTELSGRMIELDFDAKYTPRRSMNELDLLGIRMNELSDTLEKTIGELKQANTQLLKDIDLRDENERMRREFISNVSHELKTPLALIKGYAEGLKDGMAEDPEDRDYYLTVIVDETDKMTRIVNQLLSLTRLEYGGQQISLERFDLMKIIEGCLSAHRIMIEENRITVTVDKKELPDGAVYVWSDASMTEQVIDNYLSNAIHYASNEKRIEIRIKPKGSRIRMSVFNTGDPIDEAALPHLWEKFYKVNEARTREYGGTGIGLSVVKAIADGLNTDCGVENYENGVCFWLDFDK